MRAATALAHLAAMPKIEPDQPLDLAALVPPSAILYSLTQVNCCKQAIALKTPLPSDNSCIAQAVCAVVPILRHGRPSSWANRESSRITVADCSACRIWIIVRGPCSTASDHQPRAAFTSTLSTNSSPGTAPNLDWPSIAS